MGSTWMNRFYRCPKSQISLSPVHSYGNSPLLKTQGSVPASHPLLRTPSFESMRKVNLRCSAFWENQLPKGHGLRDIQLLNFQAIFKSSLKKSKFQHWCTPAWIQGMKPGFNMEFLSNPQRCKYLNLIIPSLLWLWPPFPGSLPKRNLHQAWWWT